MTEIELLRARVDELEKTLTATINSLETVIECLLSSGRALRSLNDKLNARAGACLGEVKA